MLEGICAPKRGETTRGWQKLYLNVEFQNLCFTPNIIRMIKTRIKGWEGYVARIRQTKKLCTRKYLVKKPEGKRPFRRQP
jgi:hypothetical protein